MLFSVSESICGRIVCDERCKLTTRSFSQIFTVSLAAHEVWLENYGRVSHNLFVYRYQLPLSKILPGSTNRKFFKRLFLAKELAFNHEKKFPSFADKHHSLSNVNKYVTCISRIFHKSIIHQSRNVTVV